MEERRNVSGSKLNAVFYAESYHPIQAGSIDGTDILPHDNAVYRAQLCSSAGLYDPFGDPKVIGDPFCTVFVGRLSHSTTEDTLRKAMSKYGRVKDLRLVRDIVTGASRGYAFIEYETEREMRRAYKDAHHSMIDDCEIIVDYNRQQLMPGWIPRRLGGGLGGKKESGQLRFGGRDKPFRAPLRPIPYEDLKRLGIPPPPEGRYMSRFQDPSPPRRERSSVDREESSHKSSKSGREHNRKRSSVDREESSHKSSKSGREHSRKRSSVDSKERYHNRKSMDREELSYGRSSEEREEYYSRRTSEERDDRSTTMSSAGREGHHKRGSVEREEYRSKRTFSEQDDHSVVMSSTGREEHHRKRSSSDRSHKRSSNDEDERPHKRHKHSSHSHRHDRRSTRHENSSEH